LLSLYVGLVLFGVSMALLIRARLGLDPWDVLHQGLARQLQVPFGDVVIGVSAAVLLLWLPAGFSAAASASGPCSTHSASGRSYNSCCRFSPFEPPG
jgi:hypothetical protein